MPYLNGQINSIFDGMGLSNRPELIFERSRDISLETRGESPMSFNAPHHLLIHRRDAEIYHDLISPRLPQLRIHSSHRSEEALEFIEEVDIILSSAWQMGDDLLKRARRLLWLASSTAGNERFIDNPSLPEAVVLTKVVGYGERMAEYVFAYLLYFSQHVEEHMENQRKRVWDRTLALRGKRALHGQTLGILGLGSIGRVIARRGKQFGMKVIGLKRTPEPVEHVDQVFGPEELVKMISLCDDLIVVLPLTRETHHILGERELALMKEGATLISAGRGQEFDQEALIRVLRAKRINAVLDVFETEPLPSESVLWGMENVIITPHVAGADHPPEVCEEFIANYERWIKGEPLLGVVDRKKGY